MLLMVHNVGYDQSIDKEEAFTKVINRDELGYWNNDCRLPQIGSQL